MSKDFKHSSEVHAYKQNKRLTISCDFKGPGKAAVSTELLKSSCLNVVLYLKVLWP